VVNLFLKVSLSFQTESFPFHALEYPVILDEVQKVPQVLDEVHWLMENKGFRFILCGSSARKLKRGKANLLGGRAWRYEMFPLVTTELEDINLLNSDTSSLKQFATGKLDETDLKLRQEKVKKVEAINNDQVEQAEYLETKYGSGNDSSELLGYPDDQ